MTAKPQQGKTKPAKLSAPKKPLSVSKPLSVPQKRVQSSTTQPLDGGVKRAKTQAVLSRETTDSADLSCLADELVGMFNDKDEPRDEGTERADPSMQVNAVTTAVVRQGRAADGADRKSMAAARRSVVPSASDRKSMFAPAETSTLSLSTTMDLLEAKGSVNMKMKQEESLGEWLTHVFVEAHCGPTQQQQQGQPTALRALAQSRQDAKARLQLKSVLNRASVQKSLNLLQGQISKGKLSMRADRTVATDKGLRDMLLQMILSFNGVWLRPAVEAVFGKEVPRTNGIDSLNLYRFLVANLTRNDALCDKFDVSDAKSVLSTNPEYYAELNVNILSKFFTLVHVLDESKMDQVLDNNPCLFRLAPELQLPAGVVKAMVFKSTKDVVATFCKEFLSKEGNVFTHLEKEMSISLKYAQLPIDEYDYSITSLIPDLQNGVVLARLVELVTNGNTLLTPKLRVPTVSRLQKVHNVSIVLEELRNVRISELSKEEAKKMA